MRARERERVRAREIRVVMNNITCIQAGLMWFKGPIPYGAMEMVLGYSTDSRT